MPYDELVGRIAKVLGDERPDVVATFGPDGITGHPDHIRLAGSDRRFPRFADDGGPGFRRLVYGAIRQSVIDRWNHRRVAAGLPAWDPTLVYHLRGVPDEMIDIDIDTTAVAPLVRTGDAGAPHSVERHEQPAAHRGAADQERVAGDRGDRLATDSTRSCADGCLRGALRTGRQVDMS